MIRPPHYALASLCLLIAVSGAVSAPGQNVLPSPAAIDDILQAAMKSNNVPAVAAVVVRKGQIVAAGAAGIRKSGDPTPVTFDDKFHLGSCTKAMTGTLAGILVDEGKLRWDTTLAQTFPELAATMHTDYRAVTLEQLLAHRAGLSSKNSPLVAPLKELYETGKLAGTPREQRTTFISMILTEPPQNKPGSTYAYSNRSFILAGAMMERAANMQYEDLIAEKLFKPLGMTSTGWGAMGTPGKLDQPWQHRFGKDGKLTLMDPAQPFADNPPVIAPAGTGHMSASDWGRFLALHASGEAGAYAKVIKPDTLKRLHTAPFGGNYMAGWDVQQGGRILTHSGSNSANYATAWISLDKELAIGVMTSEGGAPGGKACDNMLGPLITRFSFGAPAPAKTAAPNAPPRTANTVADPAAAAKTKTVSATFNNTPLKDVCAALTRDTGLAVSAQGTFLNKPVTLNVQNATLNQVLDAIAKQVAATVQVRNGELRFRAGN
jgi:CubicO group peptidase (beta-lactamase class C family)